MAELDDIVIRIALAGQDDVISQLTHVGEEGAGVFDHMISSLGAVGEAIGGIVTAAVGAGAGLLAWAHNTAEVTNRLSDLATQAGFTVEEMSGLQSALSSFGANTGTVEFAFRRMAFTIENVWQQVVRETRNSVNEIIDATNSLKEAQLAVPSAELGERSAQIAIEKAREKQRQTRESFGFAAGLAPTELDLQRQKLEEADIATANAELALEQAHLKVAEAAQKAAEAQQALIEKRRNNIQAVQAEVKAIESGEKNFEGGSQNVDLTVQNAIKGLVANAGPGADAIREFKGGLLDLTAAEPKVKDLFFDLADFMKNSGNETLNSALILRFFGRGVSQDLVEAMKHGSDALKEYMQHMQDLGLVMTKVDHDHTEEFIKSFNSLSNDLVIIARKIGADIAPVFAEGFNQIRESLEQGGFDKIKSSVQGAINEITPVIAGFFDLLTKGKTDIPWLQALHDGFVAIGRVLTETVGPAIVGFFAAVGNTKTLGADNPAEAWRESFVSLGKILGTVGSAAKKAVSEITEAFSDVKAQIAQVFGEDAAKAIGVAFISALVASIAFGGLGGVLKSVFTVGLADEVGGPFGAAVAGAILLALNTGLKGSPLGWAILGAAGVVGLTQAAFKPAEKAGDRLDALDKGIEEKHKTDKDFDYEGAKAQAAELREQYEAAFFSPAAQQGLPGDVSSINKGVDELLNKFHIDPNATKAVDNNTKAVEKASEALHKLDSTLARQESESKTRTVTPPPRENDPFAPKSPTDRSFVLAPTGGLGSDNNQTSFNRSFVLAPEPPKTPIDTAGLHDRGIEAERAGGALTQRLTEQLIASIKSEIVPLPQPKPAITGPNGLPLPEYPPAINLPVPSAEVLGTNLINNQFDKFADALKGALRDAFVTNNTSKLSPEVAGTDKLNQVFDDLANKIGHTFDALANKISAGIASYLPSSKSGDQDFSRLVDAADKQDQAAQAVNSGGERIQEGGENIKKAASDFKEATDNVRQAASPALLAASAGAGSRAPSQAETDFYKDASDITANFDGHKPDGTSYADRVIRESPPSNNLEDMRGGPSFINNSFFGGSSASSSFFGDLLKSLGDALGRITGTYGAAEANVANNQPAYGQPQAPQPTEQTVPSIKVPTEIEGGDELTAKAQALGDSVKRAIDQINAAASQPIHVTSELEGADALSAALDGLVQSAQNAWQGMADALSKPLPTPQVSSAANDSGGGGEAHASGGPVGLPTYASGGRIRGPGGPTDDRVFMHGEDGQYVIKAAAVRHYGEHTLDAVNNKALPKFAQGGGGARAYWGSNGEYVLGKDAVSHYGAGFARALNNMELPKFAYGGGFGDLGPLPSIFPKTENFLGPKYIGDTGSDGSFINAREAFNSLLAPKFAHIDNQVDDFTSLDKAGVGGSGTGQRPLTLVIGDNAISGLTASEDAVNKLSQASVERRIRSGGKKPSWVT